jgi:PRC-barrel domain
MGAERSFRETAPERTGGGRRLIASDHAKGALVYGPDGNRLGQIERLMVDEATGEVAHAVVRFDADQHPVPWQLLSYNSRFGGYELSVADMQALHRQK